jgi:autotransporter-associated beta strand protein/parallel beta-helix repeat protein
MPNPGIVPTPPNWPPAMNVAATLPSGADGQGRWSEFEGSASGGGLSNSPGQAVESSMVAGASGQYVAWSDSRSGQYEIYVAEHTPSGWQQLAGSAQGGGVSNTSGPARHPSIALNANGQPVVAYTVYNGASSDIDAAQYDPTANGGAGGWVALGASLALGGISGTGMADDAAIAETVNGLVVAWLDSSSGVANAFVKQFVGGAWVALGAGGGSGTGVSGSASAISNLALTGSGVKVALAWTQSVNNSQQIYVRENSGGTWSQLNGSASNGGISNSSGHASAASLAYLGGSLFAAWQDDASGTNQIYAAVFSGGAWAPAGAGAGGGGVSASRGPATQPVLSSNGGQLCLAWIDNEFPSAPVNAAALYAKYWNGSAFVEQVPGDARFSGVSNRLGIVQSLALAVDASGHPFLTWSELDSGNSQIDVAGNTFDLGTIHYVNDAGTQGNTFSGVPGNDAHDGLSPTSPKLTLQGVLSDQAHPLHAGDVILVDNGVYPGAVDLSSIPAGVLILGSPTGDRTVSGTVSGTNATGFTLANLFFSGGVTLNNAIQAAFYGDFVSGSGLTLNGGSAIQILHDAFNPAGTAVTVGGGASGITIDYDTLASNTQDVAIGNSGATGLDIRYNQLSGVGSGIALMAAANGTIVGNDISASGTGLSIQAPFTGLIAENNIQTSTLGVLYGAAAVLSRNWIHDNGTGVSAIGDSTTGLGFVGSGLPNEISHNGTGVQLAGWMQAQHIFTNTTGVTGSGTLVPSDLSHANLIESNVTGIANFTGLIQYNRIVTNAIGLQAGNGQQVFHNLFYDNAIGIEVAHISDVRVFNNTFDTPLGTNIRIENGSSVIEIRNNILWTGNGYDIYVGNDSQSGFFSDYNDLHADGTGKLVYWTKDFSDILDWQEDVHRFDLHSNGHTVVNPAWSTPRFLAPTLGDFRIFDLLAGLRLTSPTIDAGDPLSDQAQPAWYQNLLTNPSFESGITGWNTNPGAGTQGAVPSPFDGSKYFFAGATPDGFAEQTVDLVAAGFTAVQLDSQNVMAVFGGRMRSADEKPRDGGILTVTFLDQNGAEISHDTVQAQNAADRWELAGDHLHIPVGTRRVRYHFEAVRLSGGATAADAYLDHAFLYVQDTTVAPDQGAYGNTAAESQQSTATHIALRFPDLYTDWEKSKAHTIQWDSYNNTNHAPVKIDLYQDGPNGPQFLKNITPATPDKGLFVWTPANSGIDFGAHGLRIQISLVGLNQVFDRSTEIFAVPENTNTSYLNDSSTTNDEFTTAPGSNRNTGKLPGAPKPYPNNVLRIYSLGPAQTLYIDTGNYPLLSPLVVSNTAGIGDDEGFVITGPTDLSRTAALSLSNPLNVAPLIELTGADFMTVNHFRLTGGQIGLWVHDNSTNVNVAYLSANNSSQDGVRIEGGSTPALLSHVTTFNNGQYGMFVQASLAQFDHNAAYNNADTGIYLQDPGNLAIENNDSYLNGGYGVVANNGVNGTQLIIGNADLTLGKGNRVHDNVRSGIAASGYVQVVGNTVYGHLHTNEAGIQVGNGVPVSRNDVFNNYRGIQVLGATTVGENRVYHNTEIGIYAQYASTIRSNVVYSNATGVQVDVFGYYAPGLIANNLIYANSLVGINISGPNSQQSTIINNTLYQPLGDAIRISSSLQNLQLRNNILWTQAGYDLNISNDSQTGFTSDYDSLYTTGSGQVALWQGIPRPTLGAWQVANFNDQNSIALDPLFVNPAGVGGVLGYASPADDGRDDDFHEQSQYGSFHGGSLAPVVDAVSGLPVFPTAVVTVDAAQSPAIDRGAVNDSLANEPAPNGNYINLGAYGNTPQASKSPAQYVLVLRPAGGEVWPAGQTFPVRWRSQDFGSGSALAFDGLGSFVSMGNPSNQSLEIGANATLEAWVKFNVLPVNNLMAIASKDQGPSAQNKWILGYAQNSAGISSATFFHINDPSGHNVFLKSNSWTPLVGQWYHLAVVKSGNNYAFYRNCVLDGVDSTTIAVPVVSSAFEVGRAENAFYFNGAIDEVRLWNIDRSAGQIQATFDLPLAGNEAGLTGNWRFDEGTGGTTIDQTANHNDGILGNGTPANQPAWIVSGAVLSQVNIDLMESNNPTPVTSIADHTANDGEFLWSIPEALNPANDYHVRVARQDAGLVSGAGGAFTVTAPVHIYYVNDGSFSAGDWTTAAGSDLNDALTPATPKPSIRAVLEQYHLKAGDVIRVDAGVYNLSSNTPITPDDSGVKIEGYHDSGFLDRHAVINRGNVSYGSWDFELAGASDVTLDHLTITGADVGIEANDTSSKRVTISNNDVFGNQTAGISLFGYSITDFTISGNQVHDNTVNFSNGTGIDALEAYRITVTNNTVYHNARSITLSPGNGSPGYSDIATGNIVYGNTIGITAGGIGTLVSNNSVYANNGYGISVSGGALAIGNRAYDQRNNSASGIVLNGGEARNNIVYDNYDGITGGGLITANQVSHNLHAGIVVSQTSTLQNNRVYSNQVGIIASYAVNLYNNLVYANTSLGMDIYGGYNAQFINNTVYQPTGDALHVEGASVNVQIRNNILWALSGYDISIAPDSENGLVSDYNDLALSLTSKLGLWEGHDFLNRVDWFYELGLDAHSRTSDPQFVNPAGADGALGFGTGASGPAQIIDDRDPGFSDTGLWSQQGGAGLNNNYTQSNGGNNDVATWTFSGLTPGTFYQVAATWPAQSFASGSYFAVLDGGQTVSSTIVDQRTAPADFTDAGAAWKTLGVFYVSGSTLVVNLTHSLNYPDEVADAVRVQAIQGDGGTDDNFHVLATSPTIDAGDPSSYYALEPAPNGGRINQGNYGGTAEATTSPTQLVQILSPNGLEKYEIGQQVPIQWRHWGIMPADYYGNAVVSSGPAGYWHLDETGGTTAADASGNGNQGIYSSGVTLGISGVLPTVSDNAAQFHGNNDSLSIPDNAAFKPAQITVEAWVKPDPASPYYRGLVVKTSNAGWGDGYGIVRVGGDNTNIRFFVNNYNTTQVQGAIAVGQWSHVVGTYDGANLKLYINGVLAGSLAYSGPINHSTAPLLIGSGGSGYDWLGTIDETAVYGRALSAAEIQGHYLHGIAFGTANLDLMVPGNPNPIMNIASNVPNNGQFLWTVPNTIGDNYQIRVTVNTLTNPTDSSDGMFLIANAGHDYYVNDASTTGDVFTSAVGGNPNSGKTPDKPMASLRGLLNAYNFQLGDVVHVDTGAYHVYRNIVLSPQQSGVKIAGPSTAVAQLTRGNTIDGQYIFETGGASDLTIDHLTLTGGMSALVGDINANSNRWTISNNDIVGNRAWGLFWDATNNDLQLLNNKIHNNSLDVYPGVVVQSARALVSGNEIYVNRSGIFASNNFSAADHATISNNTVRDNVANGIAANGSVVVTGNLVFGHLGTGNAGIVAGGSTQVSQNTVHDNYDGIVTNSSGDNVTLSGNRAYNNTHAGIHTISNTTVAGNYLYSNPIGLLAESSYNFYTNLVQDNLIYANANQGILLQRSNGGQIINNTIYQAVGNAVRVEAGSQNVELRNNILWVNAGYDIYAASDSQSGLSSDYNLFNKGLDPNAHIGFWNNAPQDPLTGWQTASGQDPHGRFADPHFVNINGADNVLGYTTANGGYDGGRDDNFYLAANSPAIDAGDARRAPPIDIGGRSRLDDPGTPNTGSPDYTAADLGSSLFHPTSGTAMNWRSDNTYFNLTLPFAFPFYDGQYTGVSVSTEGYLYFAGPGTAYDPANSTAKLQANRIIAPLWDDLRTSAPGNDIYVETAVAGQVTIRWNATSDTDNSPLNFAVVLYSDGRVRFDYGSGNTGLTPTVGISRGNNQHFVLPGYNGQASLTNANSLLFALTPGVTFADIGAYEFVGSSLDTTPPKVTATTPALIDAQGTSTQAIGQIQVSLSEPVNTIDANAPANFELRGAGPDGIFGTNDDILHVLTPAYAAGATSITLAIAGNALPGGLYKLTLVSNPTSSIHDLAGVALDGDANGSPGGDYVRNFTVTSESMRTWDGGGSDTLWSDAANWGGTPLAADDLLLFAGTNRLSNSNDFPASTRFKGIAFDTSAGAFSLNGHSVDLGGEITNNSPNTQTINLPLTLVGSSRTINTASGDVTIAGSIGESGGSFGLTKTGAGTLNLSGTNSYSGGTVVNDGTLVIASAGALPDGANLTIGAGGIAVFGASQAASSVSAAGLTAPAPATIAALETSAPMVAASGLVEGPVAASARAATLGSTSEMPTVVSRVTVDAVFKSYRSVIHRIVASLDIPQSASAWVWLTAIESSWNSPYQKKTTDSTVQTLDRVLARFGV